MNGSNGIDVSQYQAETRLSTITGLDFCIAKATQGSTITDPDYDSFAAQSENLDIQFGAYHYGRADLLAARAEADFFCSVARPRSGLSVWYDYEVYGASGQADAEVIGYWACEVKRNTGNKQKIGIYCNLTGLARIQPFLHEIPWDNALWLADRRPMTTQNPSLAWKVHQYEVFAGIDRNYSVWPAAQWAEFWKW